MSCKFQGRPKFKVVRVWRLFYFRGRPNFDVQISTSNFHALYTTAIVMSSKFLSCNFRRRSPFVTPIIITSKFHMPIYIFVTQCPFKIPQNKNLASWTNYLCAISFHCFYCSFITFSSLIVVILLGFSWVFGCLTWLSSCLAGILSLRLPN